MTLTFESRMLIDGKLVEADGRRDLRQHQPGDRGGHRPGRRRDAGRHGARDRRRPAGVRRDRLVDRPRVPQGVPAQLKDALEQAQGRAAPADRRRGRHADRAHVRDPAGQLHRRHAVGHRPDRPVRVGVRARRRTSSSGCVEPAGGARADRCRRRDHAVELPVHAQPVEARARARRRVHGRPEARARHAVLARRGSASSSPRRPTSRRACSTSSRRAIPPTVGEVLTGDPRVDMISFTGSTAVGKRIAARGADDAEARVPRARRQVGEHRPRRRRLPGRAARAPAWCACTRARAARSRRACCCRARATTRASSSSKASFESFPYGDPNDLGNMAGPADQRRASASACSATSRRARPKGARCVVGGGPADAVRQGLLRAADAVRRRRPRLDDRAGGDLRPGARR